MKGIEFDLWGYDIYFDAYFSIESKLQPPFRKPHCLDYIWR